MEFWKLTEKNQKLGWDGFWFETEIFKDRHTKSCGDTSFGWFLKIGLSRDTQSGSFFKSIIAGTTIIAPTKPMFSITIGEKLGTENGIVKMGSLLSLIFWHAAQSCMNWHTWRCMYFHGVHPFASLDMMVSTPLWPTMTFFHGFQVSSAVHSELFLRN